MLFHRSSGQLSLPECLQLSCRQIGIPDQWVGKVRAPMMHIISVMFLWEEISTLVRAECAGAWKRTVAGQMCA